MRCSSNAGSRSPAFRHAVNLSARLVLATVFCFAAAAKLWDVSEFARRVGDFGLVHDAMVVPAAWTVVLLELLIGVSLPLRVRGSLPATVAMLLGFIAVLAYGIVLGIDIDCGCFGPAVHVDLRTQLLTDFGLLLICVIIFVSEPTPRNSPALKSPPAPGLDVSDEDCHDDAEDESKNDR